MSRILFVGLDAGGNVPPAVAVARALAARGHDVELAGYRDRSRLPEGAVVTPVEPLGAFDPARSSSSARVLARYVHVAAGADIARRVGDVVAQRRPDAVVVDCMMLSSVRAAVRTGVPTAVLFHTLAAYWTGGWARGPVGVAAGLRGLRPARVWAEAALRVVVSDRVLDPLPDEGGFEWTGGTEGGAAPLPKPAGEPPLVLVSLSSTWFPGQADAYRRIVAALGQLPLRAIVTTGGTELEGALDAPPNVEVRGRVPHGEILPRASLLVGHGGHSTTLRALAHGVPVLVLPMHPLLDQPMVGRAVARAGVGAVLPKSAASTMIAETVAGLLADAAVTAAAARTGERLRAQDGAGTAATRVEALIRAPGVRSG